MMMMMMKQLKCEFYGLKKNFNFLFIYSRFLGYGFLASRLFSSSRGLQRCIL